MAPSDKSLTDPANLSDDEIDDLDILQSGTHNAFNVHNKFRDIMKFDITKCLAEGGPDGNSNVAAADLNLTNLVKSIFKLPENKLDPSSYKEGMFQPENPDSFTLPKLKENALSTPEDCAPQYKNAWSDIARNVGQAAMSTDNWVKQQDREADNPASDTAWGGSAGAAMRGYLNNIAGTTQSLGKVVEAMSFAVDSFSSTTIQTRSASIAAGKVYEQFKGYYEAIRRNQDTSDERRRDAQYNLDQLEIKAKEAVRSIIDNYNTGMKNGAIEPNLDSLAVPDAPGPVGPGGPGPGPGGPGPGGIPKLPTAPDLNKLLNNKNLPDTSQKDNPASSIQPLTDAAQKGLEGLSDAAGKATDAGQGALQAGLDGVKQLADSLTNTNPTGLNEGALNLGPGGLGKLGGLPAGAGKAGGGGGAGTRAPVLPKTGVQMAEATKATTGTPTASRAGLAANTGAGAPGAGAPAAGRGGGGGDKEHKASKALRTKANGQAVAGVGEAAAVIPVVGGTPDEAPTGKGEQA